MKGQMKKLVLTVAAAAAVWGAVAAETEDKNTNTLVRAVAKRLSVGAFADVETAYWARGKIVDKNPYSAQYAELAFDLEPFGRIGGNAWSVSSMSRSGQGANRQNFYNEVDYVAYYGYKFEITDAWALDSSFGPKWVTLPGYHPHAETIYEWNLYQALENPYVTPYYLMRRAHYPVDWCYWDVGLKRSWEICDALTLTVVAFGEFGNSRHFRAQYGANPNDAGGGYSNGLMALNLMVRLDYALTDWLSLFAFVHQFDVVSGDARDALDRSTAPETVKDLTIGGVGIAVKF